MSIEMTGVKESDNDIRAESYKIKSNEIDKRIEPESLKYDDAKETLHRIGNFDNPTYLRTRNESLENDVSPITGVPFEKRIVETPSGEVIEGVFPRFESAFKAIISEGMFLSDNNTQFKECNKQLLREIELNPELRKKFSEDQIEQIRDGIKDGAAPDGYVWHHEPESGILSLVDSEIHAHTGHTGGRFIWGGGSVFSFKE